MICSIICPFRFLLNELGKVDILCLTRYVILRWFCPEVYLRAFPFRGYPNRISGYHLLRSFCHDLMACPLGFLGSSVWSYPFTSKLLENLWNHNFSKPPAKSEIFENSQDMKSEILKFGDWKSISSKRRSPERAREGWEEEVRQITEMGTWIRALQMGEDFIKFF